MMQKRAEMTMPIIVGAILAILVLVVLGYVFISKGANPATTAFSACDVASECVTTADDCAGKGIPIPRACSSEGKYCCQKVGSDE
jgi:hypothetical protein